MQHQLLYRGYEIELDGPICGLPRNIILPLCLNLSLETLVDTSGIGGNWKDLAGHVGLPTIIIELIEQCADRTKPYTFFELWDNRIKKNVGSVRKLIIALHEAGFGDSYLRDYLLNPLLGPESLDSIEGYVAWLKGTLDEQSLFPPLKLNDIEWDMKIEDSSVHVPHVRTPDPIDECCVSPIQNENIYISYHTTSRSRTYAREVKNIICFLEKYGYTVLYEKHNHRYNDLKSQKEKWILSAANIIVIFNKDYQKADESFINNDIVPSCLETDIPMIRHIFQSVPGGRSRIIPVVIDLCRTQPSLASFPFWLTGSPRRLFPSQKRDLLACIQNVSTHVIRPSSKVRVFKPEVFDGDEIRRRFQNRESRS